MSFCQLSFEASKLEAEFYADLLADLGALAVSLEDAQDTPIFEPLPGTTPLWNKTKVIGLYEAEIDIEQLKQTLKLALNETSFKTLKFETLPDENWVLKSRDHFKPLQFGNNLWICPSWCELPEQAKDSVKIWLDPGLAFGTGSHPTTGLCLEYLASHPPLKKQVMDYGCGSGILAIAAIKLGATQVLAIDHDPQALLSTRENAGLNMISEDQLLLSLPEEIQPEIKVDLLLANILLEPLLQLAATFNLCLSPKGKLVLSGILEDQTTLLISTYEPWFEGFEVEQRGEWIRVTCQKK